MEQSNRVQKEGQQQQDSYKQENITSDKTDKLAQLRDQFNQKSSEFKSKLADKKKLLIGTGENKKEESKDVSESKPIKQDQNVNIGQVKQDSYEDQLKKMDEIQRQILKEDQLKVYQQKLENQPKSNK